MHLVAKLNHELIIFVTEAGSQQFNGRSPLLGESTFLSISLPKIACLVITDCAKLNCHRRDIGFEPNSCLCFVNFLEITKHRRMEAREQ